MLSCERVPFVLLSRCVTSPEGACRFALEMGQPRTITIVLPATLTLLLDVLSPALFLAPVLVSGTRDVPLGRCLAATARCDLPPDRYPRRTAGRKRPFRPSPHDERLRTRLTVLEPLHYPPVLFISSGAWLSLASGTCLGGARQLETRGGSS